MSKGLKFPTIFCRGELDYSPPVHIPLVHQEITSSSSFSSERPRIPAKPDCPDDMLEFFDPTDFCPVSELFRITQQMKNCSSPQVHLYPSTEGCELTWRARCRIIHCDKTLQSEGTGYFYKDALNTAAQHILRNLRSGSNSLPCDSQGGFAFYDLMDATPVDMLLEFSLQMSGCTVPQFSLTRLSNKYDRMWRVECEVVFCGSEMRGEANDYLYYDSLNRAAHVVLEKFKCIRRPDGTWSDIGVQTSKL